MSCAHRVRWAIAVSTMVIALTQAAFSQHDTYQTIDNFFKLPDGRKIGSTAGITVDRDGKSVWAFERCGGDTCVDSNLAPILKFDPSGKLADSFGAGIFTNARRRCRIRIGRRGRRWMS